MDEWERYYGEGLAYCKAAIGAKEKRKFSNTVIYNTLGLALESLLMSVLTRNRIFPQHSSIGSMLREVKKLHAIPDEFFAEARFFNSFMNFCSLEVVADRIPTDDETTRMIGFVVSLKEWVGIVMHSEPKFV